MTDFRLHHFFRVVLLLLVVCRPLSLCALGEDAVVNSILIVSSYNPETLTTVKYVNEFEDEYYLQGGKYLTVLRTMNCKSFSEASSWRGRMREILDDVSSSSHIRLIILLGQEAWAAYFSLDSIDVTIPVMGGMVSRNLIRLPREGISENWEPESMDVLAVADSPMQILGYVYEYGVAENIRLIQDFFPETTHVALLTDNSYGGVSLQAYVRQEMKKCSGLELILLDGRKKRASEIVDQIKTLPRNTVVLLGTWRVDATDRFFTKLPAQELLSQPATPTFTLTSLGMKSGTIGGYVPRYRDVGKDMAHKALALEGNARFMQESLVLENVPNFYEFDYGQLKEYGLEQEEVVKGAQVYNPRYQYLQEYKWEIVALLCVFIMLLLGLFVSLVFYFRTKWLKDRLMEIRNENELILNNINVGIKFIKPDFTIKWHNGVDFDSSPENILNAKDQICYKVLRGLDAPCSYCPIMQIEKDGKPREITVLFKSGAYVSMFANPVFDDNQQLLGYVMRLEDVTEQKHTMIELRLAKEKAEESDRLKSAFLANMSHEIRTPLNAIVGFSEVLTTEGCDSNQRIEYVEIIRKNSDLLLRLINDILDISRLEAGRLKIAYDTFDAVEICRSVMATTVHAKPAGVEYEFRMPVERFLFKTDVQRIQQVLINLMSNANKFTEKGFIRLEFWLDEEQKRIYFAVTDTGCGIPAGDEKKVFQRFEKLHEYAQGTGLGLSICKVTIKRLGGDIWVDDNYTGGSRFVFWHPIV